MVPVVPIVPIRFSITATAAVCMCKAVTQTSFTAFVLGCLIRVMEKLRNETDEGEVEVDNASGGEVLPYHNS